MEKYRMSESETEIMKIIWEQKGEIVFADMLITLEQKGVLWKKNTILTFLSRLVEKGMLKVRKSGRKNIYTALFTEEEYQAIQTKQFVGNVYEGDAKGLISTLVEQSLITSDDLEELRSFWEDNKQSNE